MKINFGEIEMKCAKSDMLNPKKRGNKNNKKYSDILENQEYRHRKCNLSMEPKFHDALSIYPLWCKFCVLHLENQNKKINNSQIMSIVSFKVDWY